MLLPWVRGIPSPCLTNWMVLPGAGKSPVLICFPCCSLRTCGAAGPLSPIMFSPCLRFCCLGSGCCRGSLEIASPRLPPESFLVSVFGNFRLALLVSHPDLFLASFLYILRKPWEWDGVAWSSDTSPVAPCLPSRFPSSPFL